jgi:urea transport system permease protein
VVGALLVNEAKSLLSEAFPSAWSYLLGAVFIGSVVLFPMGLVGWVRGLLGRRRGIGAPPPAPSPALREAS